MTSGEPTPGFSTDPSSRRRVPTAMPSRPLATLRRFIEKAGERTAVERCELCSESLSPEHQHLIDPADRRVVCACDACAILFDSQLEGRYRRVPRCGRRLPDFVLGEGHWDDLLITVNMAFLFHSSAAGKVVALYPSPAGATESLLSLEAWQNLVAANPVLRTMQSDVEALLVNRLGAVHGFPAAEYYLAPIDECFRLAGLMRGHWRGMSGGTEVWRHLGEFFAKLRERSFVEPAAPAAAGHWLVH